MPGPHGPPIRKIRSLFPSCDLFEVVIDSPFDEFRLEVLMIPVGSGISVRCLTCFIISQNLHKGV